ncbi:hypothetical protein N2152v2_009924 [Parachlorella kessleri]
MQVHPRGLDTAGDTFMSATAAARLSVELPRSAHYMPESKSHASAAPVAPQLSSHQLEFLTNFRLVVQPKLAQLLALLGSQEVARNLALVQVWTYLPVLVEGRQLLKADKLCLLGEERLGAFHRGCSEQGVPVNLVGPMGKAWEAGVVKVVQSMENLSRETHPCNRLQGEAEQHVSEVIYIPIFDRGPCAAAGVVAVMELLISSQAHDYMVVANAISCCGHLLDALQLSLTNPLLYPRYPSSPPRPAPQHATHTQHAQQEPQQQQRKLVADRQTSLDFALPTSVPTPDAVAAAAATAALDKLKLSQSQQAHQGQCGLTAVTACAPTAPSSPCAGGVATPMASPAAASPFAVSSRSPLSSPTRPSAAVAAAAAAGRRRPPGSPALPQRRGSASAGELPPPPGGAGAASTPPAAAQHRPHMQAAAALAAGRQRSAPPSFAAMPTTALMSAFAAAAAGGNSCAAGGGAARGLPAWPGAAWVQAAPRAGSLDFPRGPPCKALGQQQQGMEMDRSSSNGSSVGGMGKRSLSRTASFRKGLNESCHDLSLAGNMSD